MVDTERTTWPSEPVLQVAQPAPDPRRWWALAVLLVATFMDLLDNNIVTVAIPNIQQHLGASPTSIQWMNAGYTLAFAVMLITGGRLGDIFGRKRMFLTGVAGFMAASGMCAIAQSPEFLVGARVVQGGAAAVMVPQVLAIIHVSFAREEVGKVVSLYAGIVGLAIVAGPLVGGLLLQWNPFGLEWRSIFAVNLPVGAVALVAASAWMRESRSPHARRPDGIGMILVAVGLLLVLFPLVQGRELGWPTWSIVAMVIAVPVFALFLRYEREKVRRDDSPLLALNLFKTGSFSVGVGTQLLFSCVPAGFFITWTVYLQGGLGWSALHTGLTTIPFSIAVPMAGGLAVRYIFPKYGRRCLMVGVAVMTSGVLSYVWTAHHFATTVTSWHAAPSLLLIGSGMGLLVAPLTGMILIDVPPHEAGAASGIINATGQLGAAVGVALIGGLFFSALATGEPARTDRVTSQVQQALVSQGHSSGEVTRLMAELRRCDIHQPDLSLVPADCGGRVSVTDRGSLTNALAKVRAEEFVSGFVKTLWWIVGALAVVLCLLFLLPARRGGP
ncbi:hypothetical protein CcI6DRAFT_04701 [Frankia sp. CcI6]|nr:MULTISPECIES: MFS transporter [unclassified Frankia]ESZ99884.1 hypothetical protein CcI6DRAFT_04701 [Frankia sp. CcI6]KFB02543.1 Major Facilitator Superfamily transporter [Frankia sp. Allo2]